MAQKRRKTRSVKGDAAEGPSWRRKLSPSMQALWSDWQERGAGMIEERAGRFAVLSRSGPGKPDRSVCFIYCDPRTSLASLASRGVRINQPKGRLRTGVVPFDALPDLCATSGVQRVRPSRLLRPLMDVAGPAVHLPALRVSAGGLDGAGVVVGIVDSGIDATHRAFDGRLERLWDQTIAGPGVPEGGYGQELIAPLMEVSRDLSGHGTHCAGIASAADLAYPGVAPAALLVIVKTTMRDANIADGVRFVFRVASDLGRPAVVNLSLGGHFDAHDGTDALSTAIDELTGPGRIVVCAAGNEGDDGIHARLQVEPGATGRVALRLRRREVLVNGWYAGKAKLEFAVETPSGLRTPFHGPIDGAVGSVTDLTSDGRVRFTGGNRDPDNQDRQSLVEVFPASNAASGPWALLVRNRGTAAARYDAWLLVDEDDRNSAFGTPGAADDTKVGSPGAASSAVTVASYTTRSSWKDADGNTRATSLVEGTISGFSSEGPLRNGAQKPDVAAPGAVIASARSRDAATEPAWVVDDRHQMMMGTSMAAPFVTGLVALLLQRDKTLTPDGVKALLKGAASIPGAPAGAWDPKWGHGLVDAARL